MSSDPTFQWLWGAALISTEETLLAAYTRSDANSSEISPKLAGCCQQVSLPESDLWYQLQQVGELLDSGLTHSFAPIKERLILPRLLLLAGGCLCVLRPFAAV